MKYLSPKELRVDPKNKELFEALDPHELEFLARSIQEHGLINPITITEDNLIIAGEQRYRAAVQIGLEQIPVIVRKPKDELELEEIRIDENLLRRSLPMYIAAKCYQRKAEIRLERQVDGPMGQLQEHINQELAQETKSSERHVRRMRQIAQLIPDLGELLNENHFSRDVAEQLAQLNETDQKWILNRLSASRLKEIKTEEIKNLKTELNKVRKLNVQLRELVESRDKETDKKIKEQVAAEIETARDEIAKAKREAQEQVDAIREEYKVRTKEIDRKYQEDQRQPITRFLYKAVTLLNTKPQDTANNFWLVSFDLADAVCDKAEALSPWLLAFAKALRSRIRDERRSNLKEVK